MGNTSSNVTSGVKKQADSGSLEIYQLVDLKGGGEMVTLMKEAAKSKTTALLDEKIYDRVLPFLYNEGAGQLMSVAELVLHRNKESGRVKQLQTPPTLPPPPVLPKAKKDSGGDVNGDANALNKIDPNKWRMVCWRLDQRGAVGESLLHLCLLNASSVHADLAKRLIKLFPNLIYDYYTSDEYYGETVLHMAIVNEDLPMVKFMLDSGADYHMRSIGSFFSPEDQKSSREDTLEYEWIKVCVDTNYEGYVYWGEYALSFAACLGQEESYRLTLAKGADPDMQDTNGNTVLHMLVIHEKLNTFNMAFELGASMDIKNWQGLTPLTLAAKLACKDIFFHILKLEREVYWQIGGIVCAAYPLQHIDTIDTATGEINNVSALNLIVYGDREGHIDMMDRMVMDLLHAKWNSFVKFRFHRSFAMFCTYFLFSITCFVLRPGPGETEDGTQVQAGGIGAFPKNVTLKNHPTVPPGLVFSGNIKVPNGTNISSHGNISASNHTDDLLSNATSFNNNFTFFGNTSENANASLSNSECNNTINATDGCNTTSNATDDTEQDWSDCYLVPSTSTTIGVIRWVAETGTLLGAVWYLGAASKELSFLGYHLFMENMRTLPSRVLFMFSCTLVVLMLPLRLSCASKSEDVVAVLVMLSTAPYFLFFCRGFKIVGPFVVMVYKMIMGDLLRFVAIYLVFVLGFSQAFFVLFLSHYSRDGNSDNYFQDPVESIMAMFIMSMQEFADMYNQFDNIQYPTVAKILFIMYMGLVALLLVNMLIAMMGNTYQIIAETRNEWQRQWARIVLVVERGVSPGERLQNQTLYSQPMADGRRAFVVRIQQKDEDKEEIKEIHNIKMTHIKNSKRRAKGSNILATPQSSPRRINSSSDPGSNPSLL